MVDQRIEKLADLMVNYSLGIKPNDKVVVRAHTVAEPLIKALNRKILQAGGHPFLWLEFPGIEGDLVRYGNDEQIEFIPEPVSIIYQYLRLPDSSSRRRQHPRFSQCGFRQNDSICQGARSAHENLHGSCCQG